MLDFQDYDGSGIVFFHYLDLELYTPCCWFPVRDSSVALSVDLLKLDRQRGERKPAK